MSSNNDRLKFLKELLSQTIDKVLEEELAIEALKSEKYKLERGLLLLSFNKGYLKDSAKIVSISAFKVISSDLGKVKDKIKETDLLISKKEAALESLYNRENFVLDEIQATNDLIEKESKVIMFDPSRKKK